VVQVIVIVPDDGQDLLSGGQVVVGRHLDVGHVDRKGSDQLLEIRKRGKLAKAGLVEARGSGRGRTYMLSAKVYRTTGQKVAYIRQAGFEPIQQEQMVLNYIDKHGSTKRAEVMDLCRITKDQAYNLLSRLKDIGKIEQTGERKGAIYIRKR
jgi:DNA-binding transcriptional ArsR family regulator